MRRAHTTTKTRTLWAPTTPPRNGLNSSPGTAVTPPPHSHLRRQDQYLGANPNEAVWLSQHWPKGTRKRRNGPCLITTYERTVAVCDEASQECGSTRPPPTHSWFHAMDPDTYPDPMYSGAPRCKAKSCMRYYKRHGAFYCIHDPPLYM